MGIAFSKQPIVRATATGATRAQLIASIVSILGAAGWSGAELANGWCMTCASPQGLQAKLWIQDLGATMYSTLGPAISLRMSCADDSSLTEAHRLVASAAREYDVIAGVCQVFIALPGASWQVAPDGFWGYHFAAGVPWLPTTATGDCAGQLVTGIDAAWWLSSTGGESFRNGRYHEYANWAGYWATDGLATRGHVGDGCQLQMRVKSLLNSSWATSFPGLPAVVFGDGKPLYFDPLIAWGSPVDGGPPSIRGQIWDAVWRSAPLDLGETFELQELDEETAQTFPVTFENWTYSGESGRAIPTTWLGCLCLALPGTGGPIEANHAY